MAVYERVAEEIKDLDICILVNNAGVLSTGYMKNMPIEDIRDMTVVNTYPFVLLTKVLLERLA